MRGEFDGVGYATGSTSITLASTEICGPRGAGVVFADMVDRAQIDKLANTRPRGKRSGTPGDIVTIEGVIEKVDDGRFVSLKNGVVR